MAYNFGPNTGQWQIGKNSIFLGNTSGSDGAMPTYRSPGVDGISPELAKAIGYMPSGTDDSSAFDDFLAQKGLRLGQQSSGGFNNQQLFDAQNNPVGQQYRVTQDQDPGNIFLAAMLGAGGFGASAALGAGAVVGGGGANAGGIAGTGLPEYSAYTGPGSAAGYAAGPGGLSTGASEGALGMGAGYTVPGAGAIPAGMTDAQIAALSTAGGGSGIGSLLGTSGGFLGSGISNNVVGSLIGAGAGLLGSGKGGLNSATQTSQNTLDPRIASLLYDKGGLLPGASNLYQQQMATGGLNPLQQQGIASQQAALQDPNYAQGFNAMKSAGMGLLGSPIAGNPFTSGQRQLPSLMQDPRKTIQPVGLLGRT